MNYVIECDGALVNEAGEEPPLKAGDFALVNPDEKQQYRNKGDVPFGNGGDVLYDLIHSLFLIFFVCPSSEINH